MAMKFFTRSLLPIRSHLLYDGARSTFQDLIQNALQKTRQFVRVFCRKENDFPSNHYRYQYRLPVDFAPKNSGPTVFKNSNFIPYRRGFIQKVTSRWASNSLAGTASQESKKRLLRGAAGPMLCFMGFTLAEKSSLLTSEEELEGVTYEIREAFSQIAWQNLVKKCTPADDSGKELAFSDLKVGEMIAKGCNAAVYTARWGQGTNESVNKMEETISAVKTDEDLASSTRIIMSHSEGEVKNSANIGGEELMGKKLPYPTENLDPCNLAVKVMFNYSAESNAFAIWRAMHRETLPAVADNITGFKISKKKRLLPHPNVVEMYGAFADYLPLLPGAFSDYPQALPLRLSSDGCGRNMTLFLVMKRYHCSLKEYLQTQEPTARTCLLLLTQLLEGLVHLLQNDVAHRDLKTDNILLDLTYGSSSPRLAITDFGCCLESLKLYYSSESVDKGGNIALMAPEVVNVEAGPFSVIDYSRSDLWSAGALIYEIFGGSNPFYSSGSRLKSDRYTEEDLPPMPPKAPMVIQKLGRDMLHVDPHLRPSPSLAATICQLLLHAPPGLLEGTYSTKTYRKALDWMFIMSAETYMQATVGNSKTNSLLFELRRTFCSRIQFSELLEALRYIMNT